MDKIRLCSSSMPMVSFQIQHTLLDGGDGVNHYTVPNSRTPDIVNITRMSNVNQPGLWVYKVDNYRIIAGVRP